MLGHIKNLISQKQFGFIVDPTTRTEYFFHREDFNGHWNDLVRDFNNDTPSPIVVKFDVVNSSKGARAGNVSRMDFPNHVNGS